MDKLSNFFSIDSNVKSYTINRPGINPYGIEFSPDGNLLYSTVYELGGAPQPAVPSFIYQFDLKAGLKNPVIVDSVPDLRIIAMQLAPDGRSYISTTNNLIVKRDSLDVIYNPNRLGAACNHNLLNHVPGSGFPLLGRKSLYSLPNFVQSFLNVPAFTWDSVCHGDATRFHITNKANIDAVSWNFGDGTTSTVLEPVHSFAAPGTYMVKLTQQFNGESYTDSVSVTNYPLPFISFTDTILLYSGSSINLHAGGGFNEYMWSTASTDSIIPVSQQGTYWAQVQDNHCCINSDTTFIKVFKYFIPNAFTPNGDGKNDQFRVIGLYKNIDFRMYIYDRWGTAVFESDNIDQGWDGISNGQVCPADSYVWMVQINFLGQDIITQGDVKFKGTVTLVR